MWGGGEAGAPM